MAKRLLVGTKKGLFTLRRGAGATPWRIAGLDFEGQRVTMMLHDKRDGALYAAIDGGHFGQKLHKSEDGGKSWAEVTTPAYPKAKGAKGKKAEAPALNLIWSMEAAGKDMPGVIYAGTQPGGLFRSKDGAKTWKLVEPLWNAPERPHWMGGGADKPGIHSICIHPKDSKKMMVGVSVGGVYATEDGGKTWATKSKGVWAAYMPPDMKELSGRAGPAPHRAVPRRSELDLDAASQRRLPHDQWRHAMEGHQEGRRPRSSASPSRCTRRTAKPPGSSPQSRTSGVFRSTVRSSFPGRATAARRSKS